MNFSSTNIKYSHHMNHVFILVLIQNIIITLHLIILHIQVNAIVQNHVMEKEKDLEMVIVKK